MYTEPELLNERLERLAIVLDEIMPQCALLVRDAIVLLKEQEPLEPYACEGDMKCGNGCEIVGYIRESDGKIERLANYCPYCGRPVKWD